MGKGAKDPLDDGDATKLAAQTAGQRLKRVAALALPDVAEMRTRVAELEERVDRKLEAVPAERLVSPPATIATPAALQYALLGDGPEVAELREMFENLLAASIDRDTAASVHPAFVSMISQLTPDEARILKSIDRDDMHSSMCTTMVQAAATDYSARGRSSASASGSTSPGNSSTFRTSIDSESSASVFAPRTTSMAPRRCSWLSTQSFAGAACTPLMSRSR
jgi:hypothetical protein